MTLITNNDPNNEILKQKLQTFGLTANESLIYLYLISRSSALGGSKIALGTGLHRQYIYDSLPKLIELELVSEEKVGKFSKYRANSPLQIERIASRRTLLAYELSKELNKVSKVGNEQDFEIIQGTEAIRLFEMHFSETAIENTVEYIIGGSSGEFEKIMGDDYSEYLRNIERKNIQVKYIGSTTEKDYYSKSFLNYKNQSSRFINKLPTGICNIVVRNNGVLFYSFLKPQLIYILKSDKIYEHYKSFFETLWEIARD